MKCMCGHDDEMHNNADRCLAEGCYCRGYDEQEADEVTQHTPGPWILQNQTDAGQFEIEAKDWGIIIRAHDYSDETEANARLIAAAPDLLVGLEAALLHLEYLTGEDATKAAYDIAYMKSAIAKAEQKF
jgi:hypothetical protein